MVLSDTNKSQNQQIKQFLWIIFLGIAVGVIAVLLLANFYGPSGRYKAKNVLLAPQTLKKLWYSDTNPKTGGTSRFVFQKIEFVSSDRAQRVELNEEEYQSFYELVANDQSVLHPSEKILSLFEDKRPMQIIITVKTESDAEWQAVTKIFQIVEFSPEGNDYRIELHEDNPGSNWVYFNHHGIAENLSQRFDKK